MLPFEKAYLMISEARNTRDRPTPHNGPLSSCYGIGYLGRKSCTGSSFLLIFVSLLMMTYAQPIL